MKIYLSIYLVISCLVTSEQWDVMSDIFSCLQITSGSLIRHKDPCSFPAYHI